MQLFKKSISLLIIVLLLFQLLGLGVTFHTCEETNQKISSVIIFGLANQLSCDKCNTKGFNSCCSSNKSEEGAHYKSKCCSDTQKKIKIDYSILSSHSPKILFKYFNSFNSIDIYSKINKNFKKPIRDIRVKPLDSDIINKLCTYLI